MAPELFNPSGFGLTKSEPSKKSDIYALGVTTYEVGIGRYIPTATINRGT